MPRSHTWQRNPIVPIPTMRDIAEVASTWCGAPVKWEDVLTVRNLLAGHRFGCEWPGPVGLAYRALRQSCAASGARGKRAAILIAHDELHLLDAPPHNPGKALLKETANLIREGDVEKMRRRANELRALLDDDPLGQYPPHAGGRGFFD